MGKSRKRAVDILGVQHQSGRCGSRASGRTSRKTIANGGRPTASRGRSIPQFPKALGLIQEVGELAEKEGYHPTSTSAGLCDCLEGPRKSKDCMRTTSSWRARLIGCSIARTISSITRSEKLRERCLLASAAIRLVSTAKAAPSTSPSAMQCRTTVSNSFRSRS
jgi:hypothetical protein